jgi:hypothetical protein
VTSGEPAAYKSEMRLVPLGIVLILVVTACGVGSHAPRAANVSARFASAPHPTTAGNRRAAKRSAGRLLDRLLLPLGAVQLRAEPTGDGGVLGRAYRVGEVDRHRYWRVHATLDSVLGFLKTHAPQHSRCCETSENPLGIGFFLRPIYGRVNSRMLVFTLVGLPHGWTGMRVDSGAAWVVERSAAERVPEGVREVDVRAPKLSKRVTNRAKVKTIVRWIDALPLSRSGGKCAVPMPRFVRLTFRSAGGAPLARAAVPEIHPGCLGITFTIHGRNQPGLGDQIRLLLSLQRLLGARFALPAGP